MNNSQEIKPDILKTDALKTDTEKADTKKIDAKKNNQTKQSDGIQISRSIGNKITDAITNAIKQIGLLLAKMFDFIFGTKLSKSPFLNKKTMTGTQIINQNKQHNQDKNHDKTTSKSKDRQDKVKISRAPAKENKKDNLIEMKHVLNGKASDTALRKQQERQAGEGHSFFSKALQVEQKSSIAKSR